MSLMSLYGVCVWKMELLNQNICMVNAVLPNHFLKLYQFNTLSAVYENSRSILDLLFVNTYINSNLFLLAIWMDAP